MTGGGRLAADYAEARSRFLDAALIGHARVRAIAHPLVGPDGEALATDVALIGDPEAPARLLVISGTHGVEGFAGSACQEAMLGDGRVAESARDGDISVVLPHAINPFGFAWVRRVNEDNVDLNRNCVDFSAPLPANPGYDELADALVPRHWDDTTEAETGKVLLAYAEAHGFDALQTAVSMGQYTHPEGVYFGGAQPVWSRAVLEHIAARHLRGADRVGILDLHTGLGPFGVGELIASHPDDAGKARLGDWYDAYTIPSEGTSVSADVRGDILDGFEEWLPEIEVTSVAIEYGTVDIVEVANALRADAWLHAFGDPVAVEARSVKERLRAAFAPADPSWLAAVKDRFEEVSEQALDGLHG